MKIKNFYFRLTQLLAVFLLFAFAANTDAQTPEKYVLVEESTDMGCTYCVRGTYFGDSLVHANENVIFVAVHSFDVLKNEEHSNWLGAIPQPTAIIDHDDDFYDTAEWFDQVDTASTYTPSAELTVTTLFDEVTRELTATISGEFSESVSGDWRYSGIIVEDGITGPSPLYDQNNYYSGSSDPMGGFELLPDPLPGDMIAYNHISRQLLGPYDGEEGSLPETINNGETHDYTFTYTLPEDWNEDYIYVIGYLVAPDGTPDGRLDNACKSDTYIKGNENAKPLFTNHFIPTGFVDFPFELDIYVTDPDDYDENLELFVESLPDWLSISGSTTIGNIHQTALISGTPVETGTFDIHLGVTDGKDTVYRVFEITVDAPLGSWELVGDAGFSPIVTFEGVRDVVSDTEGNIYTTLQLESGTVEVFKYSIDPEEWAQLGNLAGAHWISATLRIASDGMTPYVAYGDNGYLVKKWEDNSWVQVGETLPLTNWQLGFDLDSNDNPYLATGNATYDGGVAYRFTGSEWESLGEFAAGDLEKFLVRLDSDDNMHVIYFDWNTGGSYVSKYEGGEWTTLGDGTVSTGYTGQQNLDLVIGSDNTPYACLHDLIFNPWEVFLNVYKFNGSEWEVIGDDLLEGAEFESPSMEITSDDELVVTYVDSEYGSAASAMKYNGDDWEIIGYRGFSGGTAGSPQIGLVNGTDPVVVYFSEIGLPPQIKASCKIYTPPALLCQPLYVDGCDGGKNINDFVLEEIENLGSGCENTYRNGWSVYYNMSPANLELGNTYTIQISSEDPYQRLSVWIDFNDDLILTEDERVVTNFNMETGGETYDVEFTVPDDTAALGTHFLRARTNWYFDCLDPCEEFEAGEAEDYYVSIDYATGVNIQEEYEASIYPNPVNNILYIEHQTDMQRIIVSDMLGKVVRDITVTGKKAGIEMNNLKDGVYFISLVGNNNSRNTYKVIKN